MPGQLSLFDPLEGQNRHGKRIEEAQARDALHNAQGTSAHDAHTNSARAGVDDALRTSCKASTSSTPMTAQKTSISSSSPRSLPEKSTLASQADGLFGWQHVIDKQKTCA